MSWCTPWGSLVRVRLTSAAFALALAGCGSVGPTTQRPQPTGDLSFATPVCEPALVLECEQLCLRGNIPACETAGHGYLSGEAIPQDLERAARLLQRACEQQQPLACSAWAKMALDDLGPEMHPRQARAYLEEGCDAGDGDACVRVGETLLGEGAKASEVKHAYTLFERACEANHMQGCYRLGLAKKTGAGDRQRDPVAALELLERACDADVGDACFEAADTRLQPGGAQTDVGRGRRQLEKGCELDSAPACGRLARLLTQGGNQRHAARARQLYERACDQQHVQSCHDLAEHQLSYDPRTALTNYARACDGNIAEACLAHGKLLDGRLKGVRIERAMALPSYQQACKSGLDEACGLAAILQIELSTDGQDTKQLISGLERGCEAARLNDACFYLGVRLAAGQGTRRDGARASRLLGPLCQDGRAAACHHLGHLVEFGYGVERNVLGAYRLYEKGCQHGEAAACLEQARWQLLGGPGIERQERAAVEVLRTQCGAKVARACLLLGDAYQTGTGVMPDTAKAKELFEQQCDVGVQEGCAYLGYLHITAKQRGFDREHGERLLRAACDAANGRACYFRAQAARVTQKEQRELLDRACQLEVSEACQQTRPKR